MLLDFAAECARPALQVFPAAADVAACLDLGFAVGLSMSREVPAKPKVVSLRNLEHHSWWPSYPSCVALTCPAPPRRPPLMLLLAVTASYVPALRECHTHLPDYLEGNLYHRLQSSPW